MPRNEIYDRTQVQAHDPLVGTIFDRRFHIDFRIAVGGFGAIYQVTHKASGHEFALKILHPRLANDPGVIARFQREGETLTRLRDPHTIIAYELGEAEDGTLFIVLELLHGENLYERYRSGGPLDWRRMARIARGVCSSLEEAHGFGIVHRDLKPTNINLERKDGDPDFVKVLDFGIAKILRDSDMDSTDLTNAGQMIGTLDYMSPEQMVGGGCTVQTDIYTLGIVMYEMIAGRRPFVESNSPTAVLAAMLGAPPDPLSRLAAVPAALDYIVMKCLEREPEHRWADVAELAEALDRLLADDESDVTRALHVPVIVEDESTVLDAQRPVVVASSAAAAPPPSPRPRPPAIPPAKPRAAPPPVPAQAGRAPAPPVAPHLLAHLPTQLLRTPAEPGVAQALAVPVRPPDSPGAFASPRPPTSSVAPLPPGPGMPGFDMAQIAGRDAAVRRIVWIVVLVAAAVIGVVIASQL